MILLFPTVIRKMPAHGILKIVKIVPSQEEGLKQESIGVEFAEFLPVSMCISQVSSHRPKTGTLG